MNSDDFYVFNRRLTLLESKVLKLSEIVSKICGVNMDNPELKQFCKEYIEYHEFQKRSDDIFKDTKTHTRKLYEKKKKEKEK